MEKKKVDKKFLIIASICVLLVGAISFGITYYIRNKQMDDEFRRAFEGYDMERKEMEATTIFSYIIKLDGKEYSNVQDLVGVVTEPKTFEIHIIYTNELEADKSGYITFDNIVNPEIKDGDNVHIVLPQEDK